MIQVARDFEGLRQAAVTMLEEARLAQQRDRLAELADQVSEPSALLGPGPAARTLAAGYYDRVVYLLDVEATLARGISIPSSSLAATECLGLKALAAARVEFEREHPPCPQCGEPLETRFSSFHSCGWRKAK
jgi:hypothetical protein